MDIIKKGGHADDAGICASSVLNVLEPISTGVGGEVFVLVYGSTTI